MTMFLITWVTTNPQSHPNFCIFRCLSYLCTEWTQRFLIWYTGTLYQTKTRCLAVASIVRDVGSSGTNCSSDISFPTEIKQTIIKMSTFSALMTKLLQLALAGLQCWSHKWLLSLNIKTCCIVSYGRSVDKTTTYDLVDRNNQEAALERCDKVKDLGVSFDEQETLLWQRDRATRLSVEILQLQNIPIVWNYLRDPTFSRFYTIPECDRHTHTQRRSDRYTTTACTALA